VATNPVATNPVATNPVATNPVATNPRRRPATGDGQPPATASPGDGQPPATASPGDGQPRRPSVQRAEPKCHPELARDLSRLTTSRG
jgi:hypothetical protein